MTDEHTPMDVDQPIPGPSRPSPPPASAPIPAVYVLPAGPPIPRTRLLCTDELIVRFGLLPAYDRYVRPYALENDDDLANPPSPQPDRDLPPPSPGKLDKGKSRATDAPTPSATPAAAPTPGPMDDGDDDEGGGKGEKKKKNSYRHLIQAIPGKHSMKKDRSLMDTLEAPEKQRNVITPFDLKTQREAFSVSLEGIKNWNVNALIAESAQAREDRKKRKELRKLAKLQALALASGSVPPTPTVAATPMATTSAPTPAAGQSSSRSSTPKVASRPAPIQTHPSTTTNGTPRLPSATLPNAATSTLPRPRPTPAQSSAPSARGTPAPTTASATGSLASDPFLVRRGVKREREGSIGNGADASGKGPPKPRPIKRMKTDVASTPVPRAHIPLQVQQQPTPQGV